MENKDRLPQETITSQVIMSLQSRLRPMTRQFAGFRLLVLLSLCCLSPAALGDDIIAEDTSKTVDYNAVLSALEKTLKASELQRVEILNIATNAVFRIPASSSFLNQNFDYKLSIERPSRSKVIDELISILRRVKPTARGAAADLRWGIIFYGEREDQILSVYFDRSSENGVINGACVTFDSRDLEKWSGNAFGKAFR